MTNLVKDCLRLFYCSSIELNSNSNEVELYTEPNVTPEGTQEYPTLRVKMLNTYVALRMNMYMQVS